ncbi:hypothetical protein BTM438_11860 [Helicobacter pylori]
MSEISTFKLIKEKLQAIPNLRLKGSWFEKVSKRFLKEHDSADEYESIDLWSDWKLRGKEGDRGIDIVITTTSKEYIAVQMQIPSRQRLIERHCDFFKQIAKRGGGGWV